MNIPLNQVLHGNSLEILKNIPEYSIDLIFADPPYFMRTEGSLLRPEGGEFNGCNDIWDSFASHDDYLHFTRAWLVECKRILKPNGSLWVIGSMQCIYAIGGVMQELGFWFINDVVWHKTNPTPNFLGTRLNNAHETLLWAAKDRDSKYTFHYKTAKELHSEIVGFDGGKRRQLGSVWRLPVCSGNERLKALDNKKLHSTQKPESLLYRVIAISSNLGDVVLDPFGGTMTTGVVAKQLGRKYIMCEQNDAYVSAGIARLQSVVFEDSAIARSKFDIKASRVSLGELIAHKVLYAGEKLYLKGSTLYARLLESGRIVLEGESVRVYCDGVSGKNGGDKSNSDKKLLLDSKKIRTKKMAMNGGDSQLFASQDDVVAGERIEGDIHSLAARLRGVRAKRLNGFLYWEVERVDSQKRNERILLYDVRDRYRQGFSD